MAYKKYSWQYKYGSFAKEIKALMRKRIMLAEKVKYHRKKADVLSAELDEVEFRLREFENKV